MSTPLPVTRRGAFLLLIGGIYTILGFAYATLDLPETTVAAFPLALRIAPMSVWGTLWCLAGLVAAVTAFWPRDKDIIGFMALAAWSSAWAVLCGASTLFLGAPRGWIAALVWVTFAGVVMIVSGMDRIGAPLTRGGNGES